jgi:AcrR family transcriptional regulator
VTESATKGIREKRKERTRADLIARARELTREAGLGGFTIDELCTDVGIARRTFFNYFATKEHAVIGRSHDDEDPDLIPTTLARHPEHPLLNRLVDVAIEHFHATEGTRDEALELMSLIESEPKLLATVLEAGKEGEQRVIRSIADAEDLDPDDPRATLAAQILGVVLRRSMQQFLRPDEGRPFEEILRADVAAARSLFIPSAERSTTA